jgi:hypothetical protein
MRQNLCVLAAAAMMALTASVSLPAQDAAAEKTIIANERAINEAIAKGNIAGFKQHVSAEAWAIDSMAGRSPVSEFLKIFDQVTKDSKMTSWDITDTHVIWADPNTAVLTYKWTGNGTYQGQPIPSPVWASTVWSKKNGKWTAIFHQETLPTPAAPAKK